MVCVLGNRLQNNKKGLLRRLFKSVRPDASAQFVRASDQHSDALSVKPLHANLVCVRIEPASEETRSQSLLAARAIKQPIFTIGRRSGLVGARAAEVDFSIRQVEPYTVSRQHCAVELSKSTVVVRDLGGKFGVLVNGQRIGGRSNAPTSIQLDKGVHLLVLGPRDSIIRFNLIVE